MRKSLHSKCCSNIRQSVVSVADREDILRGICLRTGTTATTDIGDGNGSNKSIKYKSIRLFEHKFRLEKSTF